jgi:hypothetical protein
MADETKTTHEETKTDNKQEDKTTSTHTTEGDTSQKKEEKTLTQDEVNTIVQGKVNKLKEKFGDYDEIKKKLTQYEKEQKEKEDAELSELERTQKALEEKDGTLQTLQERIDQMQKDAEAKAIRSAFVEAARKADIEYVEDAFSLADMSKVAVEGDEVKGIEDAIANLVEKKPFLLAKKQKQKQVGGPSNGPSQTKTEKSADELLAAAAEKARKSGRSEDKLAYVKLKRSLEK